MQTISKNFSSTFVTIPSFEGENFVQFPKQDFERMYSSADLNRAVFDLLNTCKTFEQFWTLMNNPSLQLNKIVSWFKYSENKAYSEFTYSVFALNDHHQVMHLTFCQNTNKRMINSINLVI